MIRWLSIASAVAVTAMIVALMGRDYPLVGHDYRYFIPRLIDTDLHLRLNGPTIQWYTPSFGSGLPAFPNPQHLEYSLVQGLTLITNPWIATLLTAAIVTLAGFACCFMLLRSTLRLGMEASTLGALFFIANGFFIERMIVGHLGFQLFPLTPLMLWSLVDRRYSDLARGALLGLVAAAMMYHGGFFLVIIIALSIALCLPLLATLRSGLVAPARVVRTTLVGGLFGTVIAAPKVIAVMLLMRQFPRVITDQPSGSIAGGLAGIASQLTGVESLAPLLAIAQLDVARVYGVMLRFIGGDFGIWELDTGLSPILFICLAIGAWYALGSYRRGETAPLDRSQRLAAAILAVVAWIVVESILSRGVIYPLLKPLPVFNALHVNARLASTFVLPLAIAAAALIDPWIAGRTMIAAIMIAATTASPLWYFVLPAGMHFRTFDVARSIDDHRALIAEGSAAHIDRLALVPDAEALPMHASSLLPYDPLLGYQNEMFKPQTHEGDIREVSDGYFNMTNPAGLIFGDLNGAAPFERIRESDRARLEAFLSRRQPDWVMPAYLPWLNIAALTGFAGCLIVVAGGFRGRTRAD